MFQIQWNILNRLDSFISQFMILKSIQTFVFYWEENHSKKLTQCPKSFLIVSIFVNFFLLRGCFSSKLRRKQKENGKNLKERNWKFSHFACASPEKNNKEWKLIDKLTVPDSYWHFSVLIFLHVNKNTSECVLVCVVSKPTMFFFSILVLTFGKHSAFRFGIFGANVYRGQELDVFIYMRKLVCESGIFCCCLFLSSSFFIRVFVLVVDLSVSQYSNDMTDFECFSFLLLL